MGEAPPKGVAPFSLMEYQQFVPVREAIYQAVDEGVMPPWQPSDCCNNYQWDRSLTDEQRTTLLRWFDNGMLLGNEADRMPVSPPTQTLPRVDLHATMKEPFLPQPKIGADEIRYLVR